MLLKLRIFVKNCHEELWVLWLKKVNYLNSFVKQTMKKNILSFCKSNEQSTEKTYQKFENVLVFRISLLLYKTEIFLDKISKIFEEKYVKCGLALLQVKAADLSLSCFRCIVGNVGSKQAPHFVKREVNKHEITILFSIITLF